MRRMGGFLVIFGFVSGFIGTFAFAFDCNLPRRHVNSSSNKYQLVYLFYFIDSILVSV